MPEKTQGFTKDQGEDSKEVFQLFDMKGDDLIQAILVITNIVFSSTIYSDYSLLLFATTTRESRWFDEYIFDFLFTPDAI